MDRNNLYCLPKIVPNVSLMPRPMAPPESESKLELRAQAQALVPNGLNNSKFRIG